MFLYPVIRFLLTSSLQLVSCHIHSNHAHTLFILKKINCSTWFSRDVSSYKSRKVWNSLPQENSRSISGKFVIVNVLFQFFSTLNDLAGVEEFKSTIVFFTFPSIWRKSCFYSSLCGLSRGVASVVLGSPATVHHRIIVSVPFYLLCKCEVITTCGGNHSLKLHITILVVGISLEVTETYDF